MQRRHFFKITLPLIFSSKLQAAAQTDDPVCFGVIADPQYADVNPNGTRFYRESLAKLTTAVEELNHQKLSFVATVGDLIDRNFASFDAVLPIYEKLGCPHYIILGNHDFQVADEDKGKLLSKLGLSCGYYSKTMSSWRFIFLDGTEISTFRYPEKDARTAEAKRVLNKLKAKGNRQAQASNGGVSREQLQWLESELVEARSAGQRVIIFNHYPIQPIGNGHNLWNASELRELLKVHENIAAYVNGHNHKGNYSEADAIHFLNLKGMVETKDQTAYATFRCYADRIEIEGYGAEPDRKLARS